MKYILVAALLLQVCYLTTGCGRMTSTGEVLLSDGDKFEVYVYGINDGALLGLEVKSTNTATKYYIIKLASQPAFPKSKVEVKYSTRMNAIWLLFRGASFSEDVFYSFSDKSYIDYYGRSLNFGTSPQGVYQQYTPANVPALAEDVTTVLQAEVGENNGAL